jgi:hypothetical protein
MRSRAASTFFTTRPRATGGRGVPYARTIINAHNVSWACTQSPCARLVRIMPPTILPECYAPAASAWSPYLTLSGCQLLLQGGPGVRLERHRRKRQALRRHRCTARRISGCDKQYDDNDAQPGRFSHAGVAATYATLARFSTRIT